MAQLQLAAAVGLWRSALHVRTYHIHNKTYDVSREMGVPVKKSLRVPFNRPAVMQ